MIVLKRGQLPPKPQHIYSKTLICDWCRTELRLEPTDSYSLTYGECLYEDENQLEDSAFYYRVSVPCPECEGSADKTFVYIDQKQVAEV